MPAIETTLARLVDSGAGQSDATHHIAVAADALRALPAWLASRHPGADALIVCDEHTREAAGEALAHHLGAAGIARQVLILEPHPGEDEVVCDDDNIDAVRATIDEVPGAVTIAVGSGTINDIAKMATHQLDRRYVTAPTAASMNGYTSAIAAVLSRGVKRTLPARQPEAIFADVDVIRHAPHYLNRAGFGDLLSKPYSNSDWLLSHLIRGVPYSDEPSKLLDEPFDDLLDQAAAVGAQEAAGIELLTRVILVSGYSMAMAGTSAPASGGEHLVSHYWDMEQHCREEPLRALHGTQVGIATRLSALLFERLVALDADAIDPQTAAAKRPGPGWLDHLGALHPRLTPAVVEEVREQIATKQKHGADLAAELTDVRDRWDTIRGRLAETLMPAGRIDRALREAGCVRRASDIGVDGGHLVHTLVVCRHIRNRYVALDLIDDLGLLQRWAAEVADLTEAQEER